MRDTIFISHATPEDNEFAVWLATKLDLCGYKVWIDTNNLYVSSDFWTTIEKTIRYNTIRFIFVASKNSISINRDGVKKELAVADRVKREIENFIIPIRFDDVDYNDFPTEIIRIQALDFNNNWANGLLTLLEHLEKENVPKKQNTFDSQYYVDRWLKLKANNFNSVIEQEEHYSSNLFITEIPQYIYAYNTLDAGDLIKETLTKKKIPYRKIDNLIFTFFCPDCLEYLCERSFLSCKISTDSLNDQSFFISNEKEIFINNIFIELMNKSFTYYLDRMGLIKYNKGTHQHSKIIYYFQKGAESVNENGNKIILSGKILNNNWHYGISAYFTQQPINSYIVRWHLIFTDSNFCILPEAKQISFRRRKGKTLYNKQWRNLLESAMNYIAKKEKQIKIYPCCGSNCIRINRKSLNFKSAVGYIEPAVKKIENEY